MNALVRNFLFALLAAAAIAAAGDQAPAQQEGSLPPKTSTPAQSEDATPTPATKPTPTADPEKQLEEFVPSEKVPADRAVAFPVDI